MKKSLLKLMTSVFILTAAVSVAQPTLTASGSNPVIGNSFTYSNTAYFSPGTSGAGQTWNFAALSATGSGTSSCISVGSTPNGSSFPSANIAFNSPTPGNYSYEKTSATAYQSYGNVTSSGVIMAYSNPEDFLHFPFTYGNTYTDPFAVTFSNTGVTFYRTGNTAITADGYGTLITPAGTYTNVTRVHMVETYQDSANFGTPYIISYVNDQYIWYKDGTHGGLASCYSLTTSVSTTATQGGNFFGTSVGIDEVEGRLNGFSLFPNPALNTVNINFNLVQNSDYHVSIYNSIGQEAATVAGESNTIGAKNVLLDVSSLPEGIYFAEVVLNNDQKISKRFVVSK